MYNVMYKFCEEDPRKLISLVESTFNICWRW